MGFSNSLEAYSAISRLLDSILESGKEHRLRFPTKAAAWRKRAEIYHFRKLVRKTYGGSKYEALQFIINRPAPNVIEVRNAPKFEVEAIEGTTLRGSDYDPLEAQLQQEVGDLVEIRPDVEAFESALRAAGNSEEAIAEWRKNYER